RSYGDWSSDVCSSDLYNNIPGQKNQAIWFDLFVPYERTDAPPGRYSGTVEVTWKGGRDRIRVMLDVWDFGLPDETHLPGDIWNEIGRASCRERVVGWE